MDDGQLGECHAIELAAGSVGCGRRVSVLVLGVAAAWEEGEVVSLKLEHQHPLLWVRKFIERK